MISILNFWSVETAYEINTIVDFNSSQTAVGAEESNGLVFVSSVVSVFHDV